jgi:hypothetical protein
MNSKHSPLRLVKRFSSNDEPLYRRLPNHDRQGRYLSDFMMLIPGLRDLEPAQLEARLTTLRGNLQAADEIVFAELNLRLNLLWVSVEVRGGVISDLSTRIRDAFPQARLVGHPVADRARRPAAQQPRIGADSAPRSRES